MTAAIDTTPAEQEVAEVVFPVNSFRDAAKHLRRPFTARAVKFKVQATWGSGDKPDTALIVSYIDARLVVERLNLVCPHLWHDTYELLGDSLICRLTVDGITRPDIGTGYKGKGLYSDALKRAAVKFGVGVSLYAVPQIQLRLNDGHLRLKKTNKGPTLILTPNGETRCRDIYEAWLASVGAQAFGQPLNHGDAENAVGDPEEVEALADAPADLAPAELVKSVVDLAWKLKVQKHLRLAASRECGSDVGDCATKGKATEALSQLTIAQLEDLNGRLTAKAEPKAAANV